MGVPGSWYSHTSSPPYRPKNNTSRDPIPPFEPGPTHPFLRLFGKGGGARGPRSRSLWLSRAVGGLGVGVPRAGTPLEPGPLASEKSSCPYNFCPQFWGRKWLRQFYGRLEKNALFLQEKPMSIKFLLLGGGGSADFIFMGARICLIASPVFFKACLGSWMSAPTRLFFLARAWLKFLTPDAGLDIHLHISLTCELALCWKWSVVDLLRVRVEILLGGFPFQDWRSNLEIVHILAILMGFLGF